MTKPYNAITSGIYHTVQNEICPEPYDVILTHQFPQPAQQYAVAWLERDHYKFQVFHLRQKLHFKTTPAGKLGMSGGQVVETLYRFTNSQDAVLFKLTFSGEVSGRDWA